MRSLVLCCLLGIAAYGETLHVKPDRYYETFAAHPPAARLRPGDTVITKLLDSRGRDETGKLILDGDNVLTGPFYIEGAEPGDTLVIRLDKVRLNRDWGWNGVRIALDALAPPSIEGLESGICCDEWLQPGRRNALKWTLQPPGGEIKPSRALGSKVKLEFQAHPSVGCIGVAPPVNQAISSGPMGQYGGNLDYNRIDEGATVYLPVFARGAFLMVGDGHAGFGDGELLGQGTETSMDVQFTVNLRKGYRITWPRVEHDGFLETLGATPGALERGFREAISEMLRWLRQDYGLSQQEAHTLLAMTTELKVASWFGTALCKIPKEKLPPRR
ncbi:MAG TPA: acetamidase/formamidase family protein [Bryobacteraceae bacterium]|nr:acetamidase/formamidase family protein [Bryobacteraceae bacterium]